MLRTKGERRISKRELLEEVRKLCIAVVGMLVMAIGVNLFIVPAHLYNGGVLGFCQLIRTILTDYFYIDFGGFDIAGLIYYIFNIPLFWIAYKKVGKRFFWKTLICVTAMSTFLSLIPIPLEPLMNDDVLASCIIGGIIAGAGIGIALKMGGSGGGMDIVGIFMAKLKGDFSVGRVSLFVNIILYAICLFLFDISTVIYSLIYASVSAFAVDKVHVQNIVVEVHIITKIQSKEMEEEIFKKLNRGITKWQSCGAYTEERSEMLYILLSKYEVGRLKHIVHKYDPAAFIVVQEGVHVDGNYLKKLL